MENNLILSKFWTRIWALLLDTIALGIFGFILGIIFKDFFISLGENAKLIGCIISLLYFTILNSKLNNGQTLGKKIMNIQVTDIKGASISLKTSLIRALIITLPFGLNGYQIPGTDTFSVLTIIQSIIVFIFGFGMIIFYIFNKETRQSVHDIIAKTYVVQNTRATQLSVMPPLKKLPFYITGVFFAILLFFSIYNYNNTKFEKLISVYKNIIKQDQISGASVIMNMPPVVDSLGTKHFSYTVSIKVNKDLNIMNNVEENINNPELKQTVETFINSDAYETDNDILNVVVISGFDIGIYKKYQSFNIYKPVYMWRKTYKQ